ncbi:MAG TPA: SDR family NAD(P)-dependent oxidoreductase, partial [Burkholderiales bacterium]|nr:SDR family NAD(P)-dependent oxidoreductase [Burkholderiales bacterium]
ALASQGAAVIAVPTDVMREDDIRRLAATAFDAWGKVHVLCNNAGVGGTANTDGVWSVPMEDWNWVLGVNFWSVLHGIRHFVPRMLAGGEPGHIVNTASVAGLVCGVTAPPYSVSKHGVVALTETLYKDLKARGAKLSASVLCPGWVDTRILESARNRPADLAPKAAQTPGPQALARFEAVRGLLKGGFRPEAIASLVFDAIRGDTFYVIPVQPDIEEAVQRRLEDIRLRRNPALTPLA